VSIVSRHVDLATTPQIEDVSETATLAQWPDLAREYQNLIEADDLDSGALRHLGLIPNVLQLLGDVSSSQVLDAGTGTSWLFRHVAPKRAFACDLTRPTELVDGVTFRINDLAALSWPDHEFDVVVASLVLMYCPDLDAALRELRRVTKDKGRLIIALMSPYFYRTGEVQDDGAFTIRRPVDASRAFPLYIAQTVGPLMYFHRSLPQYVNALVRCGWSLTELRDWHINMADYNEETIGKLRERRSRTDLVPMFTFLACSAA
jgi:SAM-dependent methyltransferase